MRRRQASVGSVMLCAMFCWEALSPGIHVDFTLTFNTYLNIIKQTKYTASWQMFFNIHIIFQIHNAPCHIAKI